MDDPAEMLISDQTITIPRAALAGASQSLQRRLARQGHTATIEETEAALWAWLIDHLDSQITRAAYLPLRPAHRADFLAELHAAQVYGIAALSVA